MQKNATGGIFSATEHKKPENTNFTSPLSVQTSLPHQPDNLLIKTKSALNKSSPMQIAMDEAQNAAKRGEVPIGAIITYQNEIIARAGNRTRELNDPTAHAEILAIRMACERMDNERLGDCDLYVTLEPCAMCAAAISFARIRRLYYAVSDPKGGGVEYGSRFYTQPTCHHAPDVYSGIGETAARTLLQEFFKQKRK